MATRFYLPSSGAAAISPAYSADWEDTSIGARLKLGRKIISSTMTTVNFSDSDDTNMDILFRQYVSDPLSPQTIAAQTLKFQIRASSNVIATAQNMYTAIGIRVVSKDGSIVRGTILSVTRDNTEHDSLGALENRQFTATTTAVTAEPEDRIVIEIGNGGNPTDVGYGHDSSLRIGDSNGTDLPEDDSTTTDNNPWVEFPNDICFPEYQFNNYQHIDVGDGMSVTEKIR